MDAQQDKRIADFAADIARNFSDGDVHFAEDAIKSGIAHDPVSTLLAIARMNDEYGFIGEGENRTRRPFAYGEMDIIRSTINTVANHPTYEPNDTVGNEAVRDAMCSLFLRALETDPAAALDVGVLGNDAPRTQAQMNNIEAIVDGPAYSVLSMLGEMTHPEHGFDISERLLVFGQENTGSVPSYYARKLNLINGAAHKVMRDREIAVVVEEAMAIRRVRPATTPWQDAAFAASKLSGQK